MDCVCYNSCDFVVPEAAILLNDKLPCLSKNTLADLGETAAKRLRDQEKHAVRYGRCLANHVAVLSPVLALSGTQRGAAICPELGEERKCFDTARNDANDP